MAGYQVTSQVTDQIITTDAGQTVTGTYVYFVTGEGQSGSVFVPDAHYTAGKVRQMVAAKAALLDEVGNIGSGGE